MECASVVFASSLSPQSATPSDILPLRPPSSSSRSTEAHGTVPGIAVSERRRRAKNAGGALGGINGGASPNAGDVAGSRATTCPWWSSSLSSSRSRPSSARHAAESSQCRSSSLCRLHLLGSRYGGLERGEAAGAGAGGRGGDASRRRNTQIARASNDASPPTSGSKEGGAGGGSGSSSSSSSSKSTSSIMSTVEEGDDVKGKSIDVQGAGLSWISPDWLTSLMQGGLGALRGPDLSGIPTANAKLDDVRDLLGGALFLPLFKWMLESGPVYRLAAGPRNFVVIGEPQAAKHVLRNYGKYSKGLVAEVAEFLFGSGFAIAEGELWTARRKAVAPSLHRKYLETMVDRVFGSCAERLVKKLEAVADEGREIDMEACFSQLTLDVIGKSVFNYDFDALTQNSPLIQAVYTALKETESRSTDIFPYWQNPFLCKIVPRQRKAAESVELIRSTVEDLVKKCKAMVEEEGLREVTEDYVNESDPSVLRFLLQSREEVSNQQLRDDLLSMLVAGHETTGSVLTWTVYLLAKNPEAMEKVKEEVDRVVGKSRKPTLEDTRGLKYLTRCINESMRLYPHPPILIRRAQEPDVLPGGYKIGVGQDIMISVYNVHHSPQVWSDAEEFIPERFDMDGPTPNEANTDYRYIPFSGGPRKCVGDQFAMLEAIVSLAVIFQRLEFELVPNQVIGMTTGATIHTTTGLYMTVKRRMTTPSTATPTTTMTEDEFVLV